MSVKRNHGVAGIDMMLTEEIDVYLPSHMEEIKSSVFAKKYKPSPVSIFPCPTANNALWVSRRSEPPLLS